MLSNYGSREDSWEFLGLQRDQMNQGNQPQIFIGRLMLGKMEAKEGDGREWDG